MKFIFGLLLFLTLTQAFAKELPNEIKFKNLYWTWKIFSLNSRIGISRPFASFHPIRIGNKSKNVKNHWKGFEVNGSGWKGFGPAWKRPFSHMDLRIIG